MACCQLPGDVQEKIDGVAKELNLKKLSKVLRVAAELSWNGWKENEVVKKLYPEYSSIEGNATRLRLEKIVESLTRDLKGLNYNFPPRESFCSVHMWFAGDVSSRQTGKQRPEKNRTGDQHSTPARDQNLDTASQMRPSSRSVRRSHTQKNVNFIAQKVARKKVFEEISASLGEQDLLPLVQRVVDNLSDEDNTTENEVISRIEAHLVVVNLLALYSSNLSDEDAANSPQTVWDDPAPRALPIEAPSLPVSWNSNSGEPAVHYDTHDAEITAKFLAFLASTYMDRSVISDTLSYFVIHALQLRASRLTLFYKEKCAQVGRRVEYIEPMPQSKEHTLQEDRAVLSNILAKFEPFYENLMDIFRRGMTLSKNLPSLPEHVSFMSCIPIIVRWNFPALLPPDTRKKCTGDWNHFQSCMRTWRMQIQQDPDSLETVQLINRIPEIIEQESSTVFNHPGVRYWLDGVHKLSEAIRSRDSRKAEVEGTVEHLRDYHRRSTEALKEIKIKLAEFSQCDHQLGILQERSQARLNAMIARNKELIAQHDNLGNAASAQAETDAVQEYTFGATKCVPPWTFPHIVSLLEPAVVDLAWFVSQGFDKGNLGNLLRENVDREIKLLVWMLCNSHVREDCEDPSSSLSCGPPVTSDALGDDNTNGFQGSKKQRCDHILI